MLTFKSEADINKLNCSDPAYPVMKELVELLIVPLTPPDKPYDWNAYGYLVLIEEADINQIIDLPELQCTLLDVPWEGASMCGDFYYAIYLANDDFGIGVLIPNKPWVKGKVRKLLDELVTY